MSHVKTINLLEICDPESLVLLRTKYPGYSDLFTAGLQGVLDTPTAIEGELALTSLEVASAESTKLLEAAMSRLRSANRLDMIGAAFSAGAGLATSAAAYQATWPLMTVLFGVVTASASILLVIAKYRRQGHLGDDIISTSKLLLTLIQQANSTVRKLRPLLDPTDKNDYTNRAKELIAKAEEIASSVLHARHNILVA